MLALFERVMDWLWGRAEPALLAGIAALDRVLTRALPPRPPHTPRPAPPPSPLAPAAREVLTAWLQGKDPSRPGLCGFRVFVDEPPSGRPWDDVLCLTEGRIEGDTIVLAWSATEQLRVGGIAQVARAESAWGPALRVDGPALWCGSETDATPARVIWLV